MIVYRYQGGGVYFQGVPARDLTDADLAALDDEQRAAIAHSPLYVAAGEEAPQSDPIETALDAGAPEAPAATDEPAEPPAEG